MGEMDGHTCCDSALCAGTETNLILGEEMINRNIMLKRVLAKRCAKLAAQGWTHRAIAEQVGKRPEKIKSLILLGERLKDVP